VDEDALSRFWATIARTAYGALVIDASLAPTAESENEVDPVTQDEPLLEDAAASLALTAANVHPQKLEPSVTVL
jgi:hypothetical protein